MDRLSLLKSDSCSTSRECESEAGTRSVSIQYYMYIHYSNKLKEHVDIMIFIERYPLKRCQGCVKLIASKVNCFLNITDLSEVQLCMSSNSWTWECPHTKDGADHVPLKILSSVLLLGRGSSVLHLFKGDAPSNGINIESTYNTIMTPFSSSWYSDNDVKLYIQPIGGSRASYGNDGPVHPHV